MKTKYNWENDVLLIEISDEKIDYAEEAGNMIIHFSKDGKPVLIEILDTSEFLAEIVKASMKGWRCKYEDRFHRCSKVCDSLHLER